MSDLVAEAIALCERIARNAGRQIALESSINALDDETYNYYTEIQRLATTHLTEMEEHGAGEDGKCSNWSCEYAKSPCKPLLTKAKRLLGVK